MFLVPLSLFIATTYLRSRTEGELSYLLTAIECLSGLWCVLFAPFFIQFALLALWLSKHAGQFSAIFNRPASPFQSVQNLSDLFIPTVDVPVNAVERIQVVADTSPKRCHQPLRLQAVKDIPAVSTTALATVSSRAMIGLTPNLKLKTNAKSGLVARPVTEKAHQQAPIVAATQLVKMQYRGTTYLKQVPVMSAKCS